MRIIGLLGLLLFTESCSFKDSSILKIKCQEYLNTLDDHDIHRTLEFFSNDFQLHFTGYDLALDKAALKEILGWDKGVNGKSSYEIIGVKGFTVFVSFIEENDFFRLIGIRELKATIIYEFDRDKLITRQTYTPLPDQPFFEDKMRPAVEWARVNEPNELNIIYPNNMMIFNENMGQRWVALLTKWRTAMQEKND